MKVSIVIATHNYASVVSKCLRALSCQIEKNQAEIIVVDSSTDTTPKIIAAECPEVRLVHFEQPLNVPQLRGKGIALAQGEIIAILDPYCLVDENWLSKLIQIHEQRPNLVIGGAVELFDAQNQDLFNWAIYINEYAEFMLPLESGETQILPGNNISYKREILFIDGKPPQGEFWKTFVSWELKKSGYGLWSAPSLIVKLNKTIPFGTFLRSRFDHGRCFAGMRNLSYTERLLRALTSPVLPFVFLWRRGGSFWLKGRNRHKLLLTLPLQLLSFGNWALGEFVGYLWGYGTSKDRIFY